MFAVVVLAQIFVPAKMIFDQENIIATGTPYKFKTQPIDPSDPFKGKYIHLNYEVNSAPSNDTTWMRYAPIYIALTTDSLGFAMVEEVYKELPDKIEYLKLEVNGYSAYEKRVNFSIPHNEFYMNETKAYDAEIAYSKAQRDSLSGTTYALIYVKDGKGVLDNVFIDGVPIADYVEKE